MKKVKLLFPHKIDRFRIIQKLFSMEVEQYKAKSKENSSQEQLADEWDVNQPSISNLANLSSSVSDPGRSVGRQTILKVLTYGLKLSKEKINVVLWLYDGIQLNTSDFDNSLICDRDKFIRKFKLNVPDKQFNYGELRDATYKLLKIVLQNLKKAKPASKTTTKVIFSNNEETLMQSINEIYEVEKMPGHAVLVSKHPPLLIRLPGSLIEHGNLSKEGRQSLITLHRKRCEVFLKHMGDYGYKSIHQKSSIEQYLSNKPPYTNIPLMHRQEHIKQWICILKNNHDYDVGIAEAITDTEYFNKNLTCIMIRGSFSNVYPDCDKNPFTGPRFIKIEDEVATLQYFLECEEVWRRIAPENREKNKVIVYLEALLKKSL